MAGQMQGRTIFVWHLASVSLDGINATHGHAETMAPCKVLLLHVCKTIQHLASTVKWCRDDS